MSLPSRGTAHGTIFDAQSFASTILFFLFIRIIPSSRALEENPGNIEEERRLFYVAITRAEEKLILNYSDTLITREGEEKAAIPSRFLEEIPSDLFKNEEMSAEDRKKAQADMLKELIAKRFQNRKN